MIKIRDRCSSINSSSTHGVKIVEYVVHADNLVIQVVVALRRWQERVAKGDE